MGQKKVITLLSLCISFILGCSPHVLNNTCSKKKESYGWKYNVFRDTLQISDIYPCGFSCSFSVDETDFYSIVDTFGSGKLWYYFVVYRHDEIGWIELCHCTVVPTKPMDIYKFDVNVNYSTELSHPDKGC